MKYSVFDKIVLVLMVAFVGGVSITWALIETRPPHWDMADHLFISLEYSKKFKDPLHFYRLWTSYTYYPPFRYWLTIPFYLVFGTSIITAISSNLVFIAILVFSIYGIGKTLWDSRVGIMAVFFVLCSPVVASQFKEYQLDDPLIAMVALAFYFFLKSNGFKDRKASLWFGVIAGLGMLTKWTFLFFFIFPLAEVVYALWKWKNKETFRNFLQAGLLGGLIASLWYTAHPWKLIPDLTSYAVLTQQVFWSKSPVVMSWKSAYRYLKFLANEQLYLLPFIFFVIGMFFCLVRKEFARRNKYPLLMIGSAYFIFFLIRNKDVRYTMPMLVGVSIVAVSWMISVRSKALRRGVFGLLITYEIAAYWIMSFGASWLPFSIECEVLPGRSLMVFQQKGYGIGAPTHEQWHQEEIFKTIALDPKPLKTLFFKGIDTIWFNWAGNKYYGELYGVKTDNDVVNPDYLLLRANEKTSVVKDYFLVKEFNLPDDTWVELYRRKSESVSVS